MQDTVVSDNISDYSGNTYRSEMSKETYEEDLKTQKVIVITISCSSKMGYGDGIW